MLDHAPIYLEQTLVDHFVAANAVQELPRRDGRRRRRLLDLDRGEDAAVIGTVVRVDLVVVDLETVGFVRADEAVEALVRVAVLLVVGFVAVRGLEGVYFDALESWRDNSLVKSSEGLTAAALELPDGGDLAILADPTAVVAVVDLARRVLLLVECGIVLVRVVAASAVHP